MIWFIGDEHYCHRNIIRYAGRPFVSVAEMDRWIHRACARTFQHGDLVWHLGDFCFSSKARMAELVRSLPGMHCIVRGSHDRGAEALRAMGFAVAVESATVSLEGKRIILRHEPWYGPLPEGVHGVFHEDLVAAGERPDVPPWNLNLSVERTGYGPVSYREALRRLDEQLARRSR